MRLPIAVLELLQWRTDIEGADELLQHLSSSLPALLREANEGAAAMAEDGLDRCRSSQGGDNSSCFVLYWLSSRSS